MKIGVIQTAYKPIFTSLKRTESKKLPVTCPDFFEKAEFDFDKETDNYYSKLEKSMGILTPQDVVQQANNISRKTGVGLDDVYETMGVLSRFSSYSSLKFLENTLSDKGVESITFLPNEYLNKNIPLTNVISYIGSKNLNLQSGDKALMIDSNLLKTIENMNNRRRSTFRNYLEKNNIRLLYFENFENGYNFLNQEKSFEDFTVDVLNKAKKYQENNGKSLDYNVRYTLNGENYKKMKAFFGDRQIEIIKSDSTSIPENIAENLNPIMPSKKLFKSLIKEISKDDVSAQSDILKFLNENMLVVTPRQYGEYARDLHKKLLKFLSQNGKTMDDVYFAIPSVTKSFMPANYVYTKINNIKSPKYVFMSKDYLNKVEDIVDLPDNAVVVVVDDCTLSGLSMKEEAFPYRELKYQLSKNKNIVFAPMVALGLGKKELQSVIDYSKRNDKFICGKLLPNNNMRSKNLTLIRDKHVNLPLTTSIIFPYMGPDFNCEELVPLYGKFLYNETAQKVPIGDILNFKMF